MDPYEDRIIRAIAPEIPSRFSSRYGYGRLAGVDRLTAITLERRVALEACRADA
jgi:hypothetical protein